MNVKHLNLKLFDGISAYILGGILTAICLSVDISMLNLKQPFDKSTKNPDLI